MIIYEVNIAVDLAIQERFLVWLKEHVAQVLEFDGFSRVMLYILEEVEDSDPLKLYLVLHYHVGSKNDLKNYLNQHAPAKKRAMIELFGNRLNLANRTLVGIPEGKFTRREI